MSYILIIKAGKLISNNHVSLFNIRLSKCPLAQYKEYATSKIVQCTRNLKFEIDGQVKCVSV